MARRPVEAGSVDEAALGPGWKTPRISLIWMIE